MLISRSGSAQTGRYGEVQAGEELLCGYDLTGRFSYGFIYLAWCEDTPGSILNQVDSNTLVEVTKKDSYSTIVSLSGAVSKTCFASSWKRL